MYLLKVPTINLLLFLRYKKRCGLTILKRQRAFLSLLKKKKTGNVQSCPPSICYSRLFGGVLAWMPARKFGEPCPVVRFSQCKSKGFKGFCMSPIDVGIIELMCCRGQPPLHWYGTKSCSFIYIYLQTSTGEPVAGGARCSCQ